MNITIKRIRLNELDSYIKSNDYARLENKPISEARAISYINNPNANAADVAIFMAFNYNVLIGYKTVFSDFLYVGNSKVKFGWLSGTWTDVNYRRKGVSTALLKEVIIDWNERLLYTNYAEESKAVYDKSNEFDKLKSLNGYRFYLRSSFKELLPPKSSVFQKSKSLLGMIDNCLNPIFDFRLKFYKNSKEVNIVEEFIIWDNDIYKFVTSYKDNELFRRSSDTFNWVSNYPWMKSDIKTLEKSDKYYFSSYSNNFISTWYKVVCGRTKNVIGVFLVVVNGSQLKVPYLYAKSKNISFVKDKILDICIERKINYFTVYNGELSELIKKSKIAVWKKKFNQNYYSTKFLLSKYSEITNLDIQSGDGDVIFV